VDSDDAPVGEAVRDDVEGVAVVGVVEGGDEHQIVGDIEVGVAGWEALVVEDHRGGHGQLDDTELLAVGIAGGAEPVEVFRQGEMVFVVGVGLDAGEDGVFGDEAGDVVDVAVRVVAGCAPVEPENLVDAEVVVEGLLDLLARDAGVALLDLGEEALLGGEEDADSVGVDGAAFEDEAMGFTVLADHLGAELFHGVELGDVVRDLVVAAPVVVLGPGVEVPVGEGDLAVRILDEDGAGVAEPDPVGLPGVEVEAGHVGSGAQEDALGALFGGLVVDEDVDILTAGEVADDLGVDPGDGLELSGPVLGVVRPRDPGGGVGSPFGGHAEVSIARCGHLALFSSRGCLEWDTPPTLIAQNLGTKELRSGPRMDSRFGAGSIFLF